MNNDGHDPSLTADRPLATKEEIESLSDLSAWSGGFNDTQQALDFMYPACRQLQVVNDDVDAVKADSTRYMQQLHAAMCAEPMKPTEWESEMMSTFISKLQLQAQPSRFLESVAHLVVEQVIKLHENGDSLVTAPHTSKREKTMKASERMRVLTHIFRKTKLICADLLEGVDRIIKFVAAPESNALLKYTNKRGNTKKKIALDKQNVLDAQSDKQAASATPDTGAATTSSKRRRPSAAPDSEPASKKRKTRSATEEHDTTLLSVPELPVDELSSSPTVRRGNKPILSDQQIGGRRKLALPGLPAAAPGISWAPVATASPVAADPSPRGQRNTGGGNGTRRRYRTRFAEPIVSGSSGFEAPQAGEEHTTPNDAMETNTHSPGDLYNTPSDTSTTRMPPSFDQYTTPSDTVDTSSFGLYNTPSGMAEVGDYNFGQYTDPSDTPAVPVPYYHTSGLSGERLRASELFPGLMFENE